MNLFSVKFFLAFVLIFCAVASNAQVTFIHVDILGSPIAESNSSGVITKRLRYEPFGNPLSAPVVDEPGYAGHVYDMDLKLNYMLARYYDPKIGRFYSVDSVGHTLDNPIMSFNRYLYVNNNPYKYTDPTGNYLEAALEAVSIAVGVVSFKMNMEAGNYLSAAADALGVVADTALAAVPIAPGVAGLAIQGARKGGADVAATSGRGRNHLTPDSKAEGDHSTFRRDEDGNVSHYAEWTPNDKNPTGFDQVKRVDTQHSNPHDHTNKVTNEDVPTPHVHDKSVPGGIRPATPDELPR